MYKKRDVASLQFTSVSKAHSNGGLIAAMAIRRIMFTEETKPNEKRRYKNVFFVPLRERTLFSAR